MDNSEKRWKTRGMRSPREECNSPSHFTVQGNLYMGVVKNKSFSGVLIEAMDSFIVGQEIMLSFMCPQDNKPIKQKGRIVRTTDNGFGVEFIYE